MISTMNKKPLMCNNQRCYAVSTDLIIFVLIFDVLSNVFDSSKRSFHVGRRSGSLDIMSVSRGFNGRGKAVGHAFVGHDVGINHIVTVKI